MRATTFITIYLLLAFTLHGQESKIIKGIAVEKAGTSIPGCSVSVKGTKIASTTNNCGEFELMPGKEDFTIVFGCMPTHDFVTFERRINLDKVHNGETLIFKIRRHGKLHNKECNKELDKRFKKIKV